MNKNNITIFEKQQLETLHKIEEFALGAEANVVASLYKNPELLYNAELDLNDFSNNIWKVYFTIIKAIVINEKKTIVDEITIGLYLEKHSKLREKYIEYGEYQTIYNATKYVNIENFEGWVDELKKWKCVKELTKYGFPTYDRISDYADMSTSDIYEELETFLQHTFTNVSNDIESFNTFDGVNEYIDKLNEGEDIGMPLFNADLLNKEVAGNHVGHIFGLGAGSGNGKSWLAFNYIVPSAIKYGEKVVFIINEEDNRRFQKELIIFVANNILGYDIKKYQLRDGKFGKEILEHLREAANWIESKKDEHILTVIPLQRYTVDLAIKIIKKYSAGFGVKYFVLDTLKESANAKDEIFKSIMRDSIKLYDVIKPSNRNVALFVTYQLNKASLKIRKLTNNEIGMAKSIIDVMSINLLIRKPNADEYKDESKELKCWRLEGKDRVPFALDKDKNYLILFLTKNRFGQSDGYQIVAEIDFAKNYYKEIGYCNILEDW